MNSEVKLKTTLHRYRLSNRELKGKFWDGCGQDLNGTRQGNNAIFHHLQNSTITLEDTPEFAYSTSEI